MHSRWNRLTTCFRFWYFHCKVFILISLIYIECVYVWIYCCWQIFFNMSAYASRCNIAWSRQVYCWKLLSRWKFCMQHRNAVAWNQTWQQKILLCITFVCWYQKLEFLNCKPIFHPDYMSVLSLHTSVFILYWVGVKSFVFVKYWWLKFGFCYGPVSSADGILDHLFWLACVNFTRSNLENCFICFMK